MKIVLLFLSLLHLVCVWYVVDSFFSTSDCAVMLN